jgi:hypothetical protein
MTKQQTLELLEKQMPLHHMYPIFYSMDTVIELIKGVEVGSAMIDVDGLYSEIKALLKDNIEEMDSEEAVDFSSAEFSLSYNEVSLDDIKIDFEEVGSRACYGLTDLIEGYIERMSDMEEDAVEEAQA